MKKQQSSWRLGQNAFDKFY